MSTLYIKTDYLKAAQIFVSKDPWRYYLGGVNIAFFDQHCTLFSADGHRFFIAHKEFMSDEIVPEWLIGRSFILPFDAVKKAMRGNKTAWTQLKIEQGAETIVIGDTVGLPVDSKYQDWRNLFLTQEVTNEPAQYNASYLSDFSKAAKLLGNKYGYFQIHHNGLNAAPISFDDENCAGLIMPIKRGLPLPNDNYKKVFSRTVSV